jgi:hypothetical protein
MKKEKRRKKKRDIPLKSRQILLLLSMGSLRKRKEIIFSQGRNQGRGPLHKK